MAWVLTIRVIRFCTAAKDARVENDEVNTLAGGIPDRFKAS